MMKVSNVLKGWDGEGVLYFFANFTLMSYFLQITRIFYPMEILCDIRTYNILWTLGNIAQGLCGRAELSRKETSLPVGYPH